MENGDNQFALLKSEQAVRFRVPIPVTVPILKEPR
jgi:hypothetical protein